MSTWLKSCLLLVCLWLPFQSQAAEAPFPPQKSFAGQNLVLNGVGVRPKLFLKLYLAGLYLPAKAKDANAILMGRTPMAMRLQINSSMISSADMEEAVRNGFTQSAGNKAAALKPRIDQLVAIFKEEIKVGDLYDFVYVGGSTQIFKNGRKTATIAGDDFKQALFGIWLGNQPVHQGLKQQLLKG
ncbi:MAG: chalcone isomerase family protein [Thiofilum sp.]|uniref:chalcone isomerase family protein n=1 Tax=Thiofilum sp. TaxID=2212733 RepID=UPI0025D0FEC5|nr:chalcone isomerase family protein [Thiofilum sp.]MBK8452015.1 chalcone isomerase family protein [Thiofilum sp.]